MRVHSAFFPEWDRAWAGEMLARFSLSPTTKVGELSKGETGKLLILLALAQRPDLLVLDEPTDGLDPVVRRDVLAALLDYVSESGATVFISSHLVHELERFCDWVGILDQGSLVAEMPMDDFKNQVKRLRILNAPADTGRDLPFQLLGRRGDELGTGGETWVVRGWEGGMEGFFTEVGATVKEVVHLDLEDGFVELLRSARPDAWPGRGGARSASRGRGEG
jgi:ABC-2 type transport system ATP-binding protein